MNNELNNNQQLQLLKQEKEAYQHRQLKALAYKNIYGYDVDNEYAWSTNHLRSLSLKIYHLEKKLWKVLLDQIFEEKIKYHQQLENNLNELCNIARSKFRKYEGLDF
jgi:hypothetical protein